MLVEAPPLTPSTFHANGYANYEGSRAFHASGFTLVHYYSPALARYRRGPIGASRLLWHVTLVSLTSGRLLSFVRSSHLSPDFCLLSPDSLLSGGDSTDCQLPMRP